MKKFFVFFFLLIIVSFLFQGERGLWEPDEGRYVEVAREMNLTKDYIVPRLNLEPHLSKPPVTYWLISLSLKIFGENEFSARLPNSIFFFLTSILVFLIAKNLYDYNRGINAGIIYTTSIFPFIGLNFVTTDTILTFFIWLYIYLFFIRRYYLMSFFMGIAFLTKGPPSVLPFIGILIYYIFKKKEFTWIKVLKCLLIFFCVGFSWYILIIFKHTSALNYFLNYELIGRIKGIHHRNEDPFKWIMYIPILFLGLLPWSYYFLKNLKKIYIENDKIFFFIIFFPFLIFCFVKSRLPLYILPLMPAVAIIGSITVKNIYKIAFFTCAILILLRLGLAYYPYSKDDKRVFNSLKKIIKGNDYELCFVTSRVWNGLNFYFKKIPEYLSLTKDKKLNRFCKKTVKEKIKQIKKRKVYFLISDKKKAEIFEKIVKYGYRKINTEYFFVYEFQ